LGVVNAAAVNARISATEVGISRFLIAVG
jgi:hypothetical protein